MIMVSINENIDEDKARLQIVGGRAIGNHISQKEKAR